MKNKSFTQVMGLLLLLIIFSPLGFDIYIPSFTAIIKYYNTTPDQVQYTLSFFLLSMGGCQLIAGPMVDKYGRRNVALWGIGLYGVTAALGAFAQTIHQLILARVLQGGSACCTATVAFAVVRDLLDAKESAKAYSYLNGALNIVPAIAPLLGSALAARFSWQASLWFMAIFSLAVFILVLFKLPETHPDITKTSTTLPLSNYKALLTNNIFVFNSLCCMGAMAVIVSYGSFAPQILIGELGISQYFFSLLFGLNALAMMFSSIVAGYCMNILGEKNCMVVGAIMMTIGSVIMGGAYYLIGASVWGFIIPMLITSSGFAWLLGAATGKALANFAHIAGTASALLLCIQMLGAALISMIAQASPLPLLINLTLLIGLMGGIPLCTLFLVKQEDVSIQR
ncbi:MAG: multidrug effflux MFS transporter [Endozoicomonas sp. (ex Botrylloides leachii)]|nr:multidrug effflux MFS transporter [Endozoicomonas sp. (ex Botrylloides leachii)]